MFKAWPSHILVQAASQVGTIYGESFTGCNIRALTSSVEECNSPNKRLVLSHEAHPDLILISRKSKPTLPHHPNTDLMRI